MKTFIQNRRGQKIAVLVEEASAPKGLVFIAHGLGSNKNRPSTQTIAEAFLESSYTVIRFDASGSTGESEGKFEDQTMTSYYQDLEDVIAWAKAKSWYQEPFILAGTSFGGMSTALFAENFPRKVRALAPIATTVSGQLSLESKAEKGELRNWKASGWLAKEHPAAPGVTQKLPWSHMEDRLKYNLITKANVLTMPVLMAVGEEDDTCPLKHQKILYEKIPGKKELHVIKGSPHSFKKPEHLRELKTIFKTWIQSLSS